MLGQHVAEIVGHGQVIGGDHDDGVAAIAAVADARDQLTNQPVAALDGMQQPDVTQRALITLVLARQRQVAGGVMGVHGQGGEHERLAGARERLEALPCIVEQDIVVHAPCGEMLRCHALVVEVIHVVHHVEAVAGQKAALAGEAGIGAAHVVIAVALVLEIVAQATRLGQEQAHAPHAVLIAWGSGQRHAAH